MNVFHAFALGLAACWLGVVVLGLIGRRVAAAALSAVVAVGVALPALPVLYRFATDLLDPGGVAGAFGGWQLRELGIAVAIAGLALVSLAATPLAARHPWGWVACALPTVWPVLFLLWLAFSFSLFG